MTASARLGSPPASAAVGAVRCPSCGRRLFDWERPPLHEVRLRIKCKCGRTLRVTQNPRIEIVAE